MARRRGFLLTVEGLDGSGKSTQVRRIASYLRRHGYPVTILREPGGTRLAERIRKLLLDFKSANLTRPAELFLYLAARSQLFEEKIAPALERGGVVLCDRFTDSTLAYQGGGRGFALGLLAELNLLATRNRCPDLTLLLDLPPAAARKRQDGTPDRLEGEKERFHRQVRRVYRRLAREEPERIVQIAAAGPPDAVWRKIERVLDDRLKRT